MGMGFKGVVEDTGCDDIRLEVCADTSAAKGMTGESGGGEGEAC